MADVFRRILVGFDGSTGGWRALRQGIVLAKEEGAELWALWVEEPIPRYASTSGEVKAEEAVTSAYFQRLQTDAKEEAGQHGVTLNVEAVQGHAAQTIAEFAKQIGADLIIVGRHGHGGRLRRMLGSTSDRLVDIAGCSVLIAPAEEAGA